MRSRNPTQLEASKSPPLADQGVIVRRVSQVAPERSEPLPSSQELVTRQIFAFGSSLPSLQSVSVAL